MLMRGRGRARARTYSLAWALGGPRASLRASSIEDGAASGERCERLCATTTSERAIGSAVQSDERRASIASDPSERPAFV